MGLMPFTAVFLVAAICAALLGADAFVVYALVLAFSNECLAIWAQRGEVE